MKNRRCSYGLLSITLVACVLELRFAFLLFASAGGKPALLVLVAQHYSCAFVLKLLAFLIFTSADGKPVLRRRV